MVRKPVRQPAPLKSWAGPARRAPAGPVPQPLLGGPDRRRRGFRRVRPQAQPVGLPIPHVQPQHDRPAQGLAGVPQRRPADPAVAQYRHLAVRRHGGGDHGQQRAQQRAQRVGPRVLLRHQPPGQRQHPAVADDAHPQHRPLRAQRGGIEDQRHLLSGPPRQQLRQQRAPPPVHAHGRVGQEAAQAPLAAGIAYGQGQRGRHLIEPHRAGPDHPQRKQRQHPAAGDALTRQQPHHLGRPVMQQCQAARHGAPPARATGHQHPVVSHRSPVSRPTAPNCPGDKGWG